MVSKIRESKIYEPYIWEAVHEAGVITVAFIAALTVLILVIKINFLYIGSFFAVIWLIDLVVNCRMLVLIPLEKRYYGIKKQNFRVVKIREETVFTGAWYDNGNLRKLYPKDIGVARHILLCMDEQGETRKLRIVMGDKKYRKFYDAIVENSQQNVEISYGVLTKIVFRLNGPESFCRLNYCDY